MHGHLMRIKQSNVLMIVYEVMILLLCSPISDYYIFTLLQAYIPYINLIFVAFAFMQIIYCGKTTQVLYFFVYFVCMGILVLLNGSSIGCFCGYLTALTGLSYTMNISFNRDFIKITAYLGIIYIILSAFQASVYYVRWSISNVMINPNIICIFIFLFSVLIDEYYYRYKDINYRIIKMSIIKFLGAFSIFYFGSRTVLLVYIGYNLLIFIPSRIYNNEKIMRIVFVGLVVMGLVFPLIYINIPQYIQEFVYQMTGKSFYSGREIIWQRLFDRIKDPITFCIGLGSDEEVALGTISANRVYSMHNNYLGMLCDFGFIGLLFYFGFFVVNILKRIKDKSKKMDNVLLAGLIGIMAVGYAEIIITYSIYVMLVALIFGLFIRGELNEEV